MFTRTRSRSSGIRALISSVSLGTTLALAAFAIPALAESQAPAAAEGCPGSTSLVATFNQSGGSWTSAAPNGVVVAGDGMTAQWWSSGKIIGLVITSGSITHNYTLDAPETAGTVKASDVKGSTGELSKIGFCAGGGAVPNPSSGSKISVGVSKTASCATTNTDGTVTVTGAITIVRHTPGGNPNSVAIRVRVARDTVYSGATILSQTSVAGLVGAVMNPGTTAIQEPYSVTFAPGSSTSFSNQIQVMVEEAVSGLDRHKYYNARADFGLCAVSTPTPKPTPTQTVSGSTSTPSPSPKGSTGPQQSVQGATGTPGVPNTALSSTSTSNGPWLALFAALFLGSLVGLFTVNLRGRRA